MQAVHPRRLFMAWTLSPRSRSRLQERLGEDRASRCRLAARLWPTAPLTTDPPPCWEIDLSGPARALYLELELEPEAAPDCLEGELGWRIGAEFHPLARAARAPLPPDRGLPGDPQGGLPSQEIHERVARGLGLAADTLTLPGGTLTLAARQDERLGRRPQGSPH